MQLVAVALAAAFPALLAAAEQNGVRQAMTTASDTALTIVADRPLGSVARTVRAAESASARVLGDAARSSSSVVAVSVTGEGAGPGGAARPYLAEFPARAFTVTAGRWPAAATTGGAVPVAVPAAGAAVLGVAVGSTLPLRIDGVDLRARVAALYRPVDLDGPVWSIDPLSGIGNDPIHVDPDDPYGDPVDVVGPLIVAPGALDAAGVGPSRVVITADPDFSRTSVTALRALAERLSSIDQTVAVRAGEAAESVNAQTSLDTVVAGVLGPLQITRTTAAVAGLLLVVLAMVVLVQAALLLDAARADERALLAARGAGRAQLALLATWEALAAAAVALVLGVPAGAGIASAVRGAPTPPSSGSWLTGAGVVVAVLAVRLLPRLRPAERIAARPSRGTGIMRSGADLVLLVLAVVLGQQLVTRRVDPSSGIDPVLVAAPAALVLAGALVALRLVPLVGRAGEVVSRRARGAVSALVGWELSRRSARATATVLLVTIAIGTGAFGAITEATWRRSQLDQSALAVGAPVRVPADVDGLASQSAELADGALGAPQPALRREADVRTPGADAPDQPTAALGSATVLGLTGAARAMLDRGRNREEGGAAIGRLRTSAPAVTGVELPGGASRLRAVVRVGGAETTIPGAAAEVRAVLEGSDGLLSTVELGLAAVDAERHVLGGRIPASGMRLVGLQLQVLVADPVAYRGNVAVDPPLELVTLDAGGTPLRIPAGWTTVGATGDLRGGLALPVESDLRSNPLTAAVVGWKPVAGVRSVWTRHLLQSVQAYPGASFALDFGSVLVPCDVAGVVTRVPGSGGAPSEAPAPDVAVVDQRSLSLFLIQSGDALPQADQWWVDVAPDRVDAYLAAHRRAAPGADGAVALAERLTSGPLRLATTQTLHLLLAAAVALGLIGFGVDVVASLDARRREVAQLRAIGLRRGVLERMLTAEATMRVAVGALLGLGLGVLLGEVAASHLVVGPDGARPVPVPLVVLPVAQLLLLIGGAVLAALLAALLIIRTFRGLDPASILREGDA
ncbi:ABC transporter permease [Amnibacterium soli]|uniref:ABC transporter permease n=1 Tax=Amnibacterium soli TaxID=1282736 RepID=A0ABP8ZAT2_9MICO